MGGEIDIATNAQSLTQPFLVSSRNAPLRTAAYRDYKMRGYGEKASSKSYKIKKWL